jgi:hypothetical protein
LGGAIAVLRRLFAQRFADQRNAIWRLAAPNRTIDEFELLLVEAHNDFSSRHPRSSFRFMRSDGLCREISDQKRIKSERDWSVFSQSRRFLKR